jgi:alkylation response protein AidB-like acyl-CoA dehydrogenase/acyl-CoA synthetase (AMP-forming)/AMP-acid ligase II
LRFADDSGGWTFYDYATLAGRVAAAAEYIEHMRSRPHGAVSLAIPSGPDFVAAFLGTLVAGNTPSPLALPVFLRDPEKYIRHVAAILEVADPVLVLADDDVLAQLAPAAQRARLGSQPMAFHPAYERDVPLRRRFPAELALLQFTSGSSGSPRGVRVTWSNLEANLAQIGSWLPVHGAAAVGSWLPLYHDMGLIGALLWPIATQRDIWIMRPDQFIRSPLRWLEMFGTHGVAVGVAPNFGYAYAQRQVADEHIEGMDFSSWQVAIAAAERLDPHVLTSFSRWLEPYGFRSCAFAPAYGLAEGTLAATGVPISEVPRAVRPRWSSMGFGNRVPIEETARLGHHGRFGSGAGWMVSCGRPHPGVALSIVDEDGYELPDGHLGEIKIDGPNVADGYTGQGGGSTRFEDGALISGDAGLIVDDELYVLGRIGDSMKVRGRTLFVEDIEAQIAAADGVSRGKVVVLAGADGPRNVLAAVVEATRGAWVQEVSRILEAEVGDEAAIKIVASPPQTIQRTSSGKPRRRVMWRDFLDGNVEGEIVFSTAEQSAGHALLLAGGFGAPEVDAFRADVRRLIEDHVTPRVSESERTRRFPRQAIEALGQAGLLRERWRGSDHGDAGKAALFSEELGRAGCGGVGVGIGVHLEAVLSILCRFGSTPALRALLGEGLDGLQIGCIAASERAHGSDLAAVTTEATHVGGGWRVAGEKRFVSLGAVADFALVLAREHDPHTGAPSPATTLFAVPADQFEVTERIQSVGNRSLETVTIEIDAEIGEELVVSRPGRGLQALTWGLTHERLASAAHAVGAALLAIDLATTHAERRVQFGQRLLTHQAIRLKLGELASAVWVARDGVYALAASLHEARPETARRVAAAKVTCAGIAERTVSDCMQILGGRGYVEDMTPLARIWRDSRLARIGGGTDEMMWELVASGLMSDDDQYDRLVRAGC